MNKLFFLGLAVAISIVSVMPAHAAITAEKDSADFTYKYEFNSGGTPDTLDLDSNTVNDFSHAKAEGTSSVSGGNLNMSVAARAYEEGFYSQDAGEAWDVLGPTVASGNTVEIRLKVLSDIGKVVASGNSFGATAMIGGASGGASVGWLGICGTGQYWGYSSADARVGSEEDNTDDFHVFRVAQEEGSSTFSVWRDGVLLSNTLASAYGGELDTLRIADTSDNIGGSVQIDYVRFTTGAYAPATAVIPEPTSAVMLLGLAGVALLLRLRRRK